MELKILQNSHFGKRGRNWYTMESDFVSEQGVDGKLSTYKVSSKHSTYTVGT
jgi:hypothetical protein